MIEAVLLVICATSLAFVGTTVNLMCASRMEKNKSNTSTHELPPSKDDYDITETYNDECPICLEPIDFENLDNVYILNCNHIYHNSCILQWFNRSKHNHCPLCLQ
tara:strand:+ start:357 stop:671 length:315 start_codon:yes stop_codon:yes gene_type:complete